MQRASGPTAMVEVQQHPSATAGSVAERPTDAPGPTGGQGASSSKVDDGVLVVDDAGRLIEADPRARDLLGLDGNRLLAAHRSDYFGLAGLLSVDPTVSADPVVRQTRRVLRPGGESRWVEFRRDTSPSVASAGAPVAVHLVDRTAERLHQRVLRAQRAALTLALGDPTAAVVITDGEARVLDGAERVVDLLGGHRRDRNGRSLAELLGITDATIDELLRGLRAGGTAVRPGVTIPGPDGVVLDVSAAVTLADRTDPGAARLAWVLRRSAAAGAGGDAEHRRLRKVLASIHDSVMILDRSGAIVATSATADATAQRPNLLDLVAEADRAAVAAGLAHLVADPGGRVSGRFRLANGDGAGGSGGEVEAWAQNLLDDPDVAGIVITLRDISERARAEAFLACRQEVLRRIAEAEPLATTMRRLVELVESHVEDCAAAVLQIDADGATRTFSTSAFPVARLEPLVQALERPAHGERLLVSDLGPLIEFPELQTGRFRSVALVALTAAGTDDDGRDDIALGALLCLRRGTDAPDQATRDVLHALGDLAAIAIERERSERDLARRALHDELTGLANRHLLLDRLEQALNRARRRGRRLALMFLDLDRFKTINDTLGHDVGDQLLRQFAERLRMIVRPEDTVARFGGDEFVVLVEQIVDEQEATLIANRLENAMSQPFDLAGRQLAVTASVGIVIGKGDDAPDDLVRNADVAMYRAKELGRNRTELYDSRLEAHLADRSRLGDELRTALGTGQLRLVYQPAVELRSGTVRLIEALLRWDHPEHGTLLPRDFLSVTEESGLSSELAAWVIERSFAEHAALSRHPAWADAPDGVHPPALSINLTVAQLAQPDLVGVMAAALARHGVGPGRVVVDVAEDALATAGEHVIQHLNQLHDLGVLVALDDVGGGPHTSVLGILERVPADIIKVDPSVIAAMNLGERDAEDQRESLQRSMAAGLLGLGRGLGLTVLAEGVDNQRRLQELRQIGYDLAQGNLVGTAVDAVDLLSLLPH